MNNKRELILIGVRSEFLRGYLESIHVRGYSEENGEDLFCCSFLKWNVYFLDAMNENKAQVTLEGTIHSSAIKESFYHDKEKGVVFMMLPFDVELRPEHLRKDRLFNLGVKLYYDLNLVRDRVFRFSQYENFANYLIEVQQKANNKMIESLLYFTRQVEIKQPIVIQSSCVKAQNDLFLKFTIKNELCNYSLPDSTVDSPLFKFLVNEKTPAKEQYIETYTFHINNFRLKFESSQNQGKSGILTKTWTRR